ncbi:9114_t:CDS:2 [Ambispora gerdemannii]|uniref:Large ribosomal subunit protein uL5m n=1 Tax=Ambispora gerdemannii TaxID=144530 RepID=A0A9N9FHR6_9GLOM|nr:9114_t:CDS:2 [Ambispora gerdemannii]
MALSISITRKTISRFNFAYLLSHNTSIIINQVNIAPFHYKKRKPPIPEISGYTPKRPSYLPDDPGFFAGRTSINRFEEHFLNTLADDLMILLYRHDYPVEPRILNDTVPLEPTEEENKEHQENKEVLLNIFAGRKEAAEEVAIAAAHRKKRDIIINQQRHINRKPKPLRTKDLPRPLPKPMINKNLPQLQEIDLHCMMSDAVQNKQHLMSGLIAFQVITSERPTVVYAKNNVSNWKLREGIPIGCKIALKGPAMYTFLDKLIEIVLPRLKEWYGIPDSSGDTRGNIAMGLPHRALPLFPEIEANIDMYPMMTGFDIIFKTSAPKNQEARLLLSGFGLPFYPKKEGMKNKK